MDAMSPSSVTFSPDQVQSLVGGACEPGKEYTLTLRAGDMGEDGSQSFEVIPSDPAVAGELGEPTGEEVEETVEPPEPEHGGAMPENPLHKALGYDREALLKARGTKSVPKLSAKDLSEDI